MFVCRGHVFLKLILMHILKGFGLKKSTLLPSLNKVCLYQTLFICSKQNQGQVCVEVKSLLKKSEFPRDLLTIVIISLRKNIFLCTMCFNNKTSLANSGLSTRPSPIGDQLSSGMVTFVSIAYSVFRSAKLALQRFFSDVPIHMYVHTDTMRENNDHLCGRGLVGHK